jgi:beta-lactamase regulating signal transducer with metallopeptidase domain
VSGLASWLALGLAASSLLILVVLATRGMVQRWCGPAAAYALWLLPALRMLLPPLPAAAAPAPDVLRPALESLATTVSTGSASTLREAMAWYWPLLAFWSVGALVFLIVEFTRYRRFVGGHLPGARRIGETSDVPLYLCGVDGPLAGGLFHPFILLPRDFTTVYSPAQQALVVAHELQHHRRGDIIANAAAMLFLAIHWFNPLAHLAVSAFRTDQELACDAAVLRGRAGAERRLYALALVQAALGKAMPPTARLGGVAGIKHRLRLVADGDRTTQRRGLGWLVAALASLALVATASESPVQKNMVSEHPARAPVLHTALPIGAASPDQSPLPPRLSERAASRRHIAHPLAPAAPRPGATAVESTPLELFWTSCVAASRAALPPSFDCAREGGRRASLEGNRQAALADPSLPEAMRQEMLAEFDRELHHPRPQSL